MHRLLVEARQNLAQALTGQAVNTCGKTETVHDIHFANQVEVRPARLLKEMITQGVGIRSFAERDPSLEDVFMVVTKGIVA